MTKVKDILKFFSQYNEDYDIMVVDQGIIKSFEFEPFILGYYITQDQGKTGQIVDPSDYFVRGEEIIPALIINTNQAGLSSSELEAV